MAIYHKVHFKPEQHAYLMALAEADIARLGLSSPDFDLAYQAYCKLRDASVIDSWGPSSKRKPKA